MQTTLKPQPKTTVRQNNAVPMEKLEPKSRSTNFNEVALGYTEAEALIEAQRCLECPKPRCVEGCPVGVEIPAFIKLIKERKYDEAISKVKEKNSLPAICGRVCPQEEQCQKNCIRGKTGDPISIGRLERFVADLEREKGLIITMIAKPTGGKIAVVGAGPAGLTAAADLAKLGHNVTVFEALHAAGGVLVYGIPEDRKSVV